jgi:putative sigma-54 modulation protein
VRVAQTAAGKSTLDDPCPAAVGGPRAGTPGREQPVEVRVHGTTTNLDEDLRSLADEKVGHAARVFAEARFADVEFSEEANPRISDRFRVEITAQALGQVVRVESAGHDERAALDIAVDKFERQLRRLKERMIDRSRKASDKRLNAVSDGVEEDFGAVDDIRIDRVKRFAVKPMTPDEAALQMDLLGHSFFLFLNGQTDRYSVLYRRRDGTLGLIEPQ